MIKLKIDRLFKRKWTEEQQKTFDDYVSGKSDSMEGLEGFKKNEAILLRVLPERNLNK